MTNKVLSAFLLAVFAAPTTAEVTLINPFVVPEEHSDTVLKYWEEARDYLQTQPGYISTSLHRTIQPDSQFQYINVAKWESEDYFKAAIMGMKTNVAPLRVSGVENYPALYEVIRN
ncbi:antibiotic biosynthesis monooxygenase family protein [Photobacterium minamisatsumaniensis]|uniref:antibiotic biosynthesis monooxygenase family protein n=1 Tax=Photobacterium minamisatsumaniensis TaxID=2910233 RepID=UPI003D0965EF